MKVRQWISWGAGVALLVLLLPGGASAAEVSGRASTVLEWFDTAEEETAVPVYQYVLLNVKDLDGKGMAFRGYGRLSTDLSDEVDAESRLYYAYLDKRNIADRLDFKLGRQFIATTAGASLMDGVFIRYRELGAFAFELFGGGDVSYYDDYEAGDLIVGGELAGRFYDRLDVGLSYLQKWDDSDLSHELFGLDLDYDLESLLNIYSETQFNYLANTVTYFLAGARYYRDPKWTLRAEYLYSLPVFSSTSIYSVFSVSEYEEVMGEFTYRFGRGLRSFIRYSHELYDEVDDADVVEAGLEKIRTDRFSGYLSGVVRADDDGQDLKGVKAHGAYLVNRLLQIGLGAHVDVLERRLADDDETTSSRLWADSTLFLTETVDVQAKVERVESDLWDEYYRGRIRLNVRF